MITREKVLRVIRPHQRALKQLGIAAPKIAVGGLNPHAGEGGLFGREEIEIIKPAIEPAAAKGIAAAGPFGADTMFHRQGFDAFIVMLHDQGHIPAKLLAPGATAALTIGTPILFSSVAHGSAYEIAGKGIANPAGHDHCPAAAFEGSKPVLTEIQREHGDAEKIELCGTAEVAPGAALRVEHGELRLPSSTSKVSSS